MSHEGDHLDRQERRKQAKERTRIAQALLRLEKERARTASSPDEPPRVELELIKKLDEKRDEEPTEAAIGSRVSGVTHPNCPYCGKPLADFIHPVTDDRYWRCDDCVSRSRRLAAVFCNQCGARMEQRFGQRGRFKDHPFWRCLRCDRVSAVDKSPESGSEDEPELCRVCDGPLAGDEDRQDVCKDCQREEAEHYAEVFGGGAFDDYFPEDAREDWDWY